jgi:opacity protein-like surface antigen
MKGDEATFAGFVNVYYDWLNQSNITPYVMLGAGLTRNEFTSRISVDGANETKGRKSKYGTGYKAGLGFAYHVGTNVDIDIGYSYLSKGVDKYNITIPSPAVSVVAEPDVVHSMMFGIRLTY